MEAASKQHVLGPAERPKARVRQAMAGETDALLGAIDLREGSVIMHDRVRETGRLVTLDRAQTMLGKGRSESCEAG
jgi:hypothetical protein